MPCRTRQVLYRQADQTTQIGQYPLKQAPGRQAAQKTAQITAKQVRVPFLLLHLHWVSNFDSRETAHAEWATCARYLAQVASVCHKLMTSSKSIVNNVSDIVLAATSGRTVSTLPPFEHTKGGLLIFSPCRTEADDGAPSTRNQVYAIMLIQNGNEC